MRALGFKQRLLALLTKGISEIFEGSDSFIVNKPQFIYHGKRSQSIKAKRRAYAMIHHGNKRKR